MRYPKKHSSLNQILGCMPPGFDADNQHNLSPSTLCLEYCTAAISKEAQQLESNSGLRADWL